MTKIIALLVIVSLLILPSFSTLVTSFKGGVFKTGIEAFKKGGKEFLKGPKAKFLLTRSIKGDPKLAKEVGKKLRKKIEDYTVKTGKSKKDIPPEEFKRMWNEAVKEVWKEEVKHDMLINWLPAGILEPIKIHMGERWYYRGHVESPEFEEEDAFRDILKEHILANPDITDPQVTLIMRFLIRILLPIYILLTIILGLRAIVFSSSPKTRARAKNALPLLIIGMISVSLSPVILKLPLQLSHGMTSSVLGQGPVTTKFMMDGTLWYVQIFNDLKDEVPVLSLPFIMIIFILYMGISIVLDIRILVIMLLASIFPLTITLYLFTPTRGIGRRMMEYTLLFIFSQLAIALVLVSISIASLLILPESTVSTTPFKDVGDVTIMMMATAAFIILVVTIPMFVASFRKFLP